MLSPRDTEGTAIYRATGCPECGYRGYRGRKGIFELMHMSGEIRELTFNRGSSTGLRKLARSQGMLTLQEDAVRKVMNGITSIQEVLRVTAAEEFQ